MTAKRGQPRKYDFSKLSTTQKRWYRTNNPASVYRSARYYAKTIGMKASGKITDKGVSIILK